MGARQLPAFTPFKSDPFDRQLGDCLSWRQRIREMRPGGEMGHFMEKEFVDGYEAYVESLIAKILKKIRDRRPWK